MKGYRSCPIEKTVDITVARRFEILKCHGLARGYLKTP